MGSTGADNVSFSGNDETKGSETMVEIKIKTLDSQTYTLRVDKCVPVPALKEQIAVVTGILSEQQRLICRGKVLKDDQLLSAYHVEDGHTLHLVVRQPIAPLGENASDSPATDPASSSGNNEGSGVQRSVLVGSFNLSELGDGAPDIGRLVSAVLGSIGITSTESGSEEITFDNSAAERAYTISGRQQPDQTGIRDQPTSNTNPGSYASDPYLDPLQPQVIPDSLTTITLYLRHLRQESDTIVRGHNNSSQTTGSRVVGTQEIHAAATAPGRLPTPESMAEVLRSTRRLLNEEIEECLLQAARNMENQAMASELAERGRIQAYAFRTGRLVQNLGALLLELGRSMMTLQMGPTPADAVVNAGPALFVSMTGPNPIMVQPQPFPPGATFGAIPVGTSQHSSVFGGASVGSGFVPRNIDIRIRSAIGRRDPTSSPQTMPPNTTNTSAHVTSEGPGHSSTRVPDVRVVPLRSIYAAVPAPLGAAASDSTHGSVGMFFPVVARVRHGSSGTPTVSRSSEVPDQHAAAQLPNTGLPDLSSSNIPVMSNSQVPDGLNQLLRTIFSGEHPHGDNVYPQHVVPGSENTRVAPDVDNSQEATLPANEDGVLVSNILRQIMPLISERIGTTSNASSADGGNVPLDSTQVSASSEQGSSSRRQQDPLSPPSPKRQKRE